MCCLHSDKERGELGVHGGLALRPEARRGLRHPGALPLWEAAERSGGEPGRAGPRTRRGGAPHCCIPTALTIHIHTYCCFVALLCRTARARCPTS